MNYLVAVLSEQTQVEAAQSALEEANLPKEKISILGQGYESADEFGLINPDRQASYRIQRLIYWLIPFGFVAGYAFNLLTAIQILPWENPILNHLVGGVFGAAAGALGAFMTGRLVGWTVGSGDALAYRNRLNAGKYLIIVKGTDELLLQATQILRQFEPENIQGYMEAAKA
jgi:hypothetical protein